MLKSINQKEDSGYDSGSISVKSSLKDNSELQNNDYSQQNPSNKHKENQFDNEDYNENQYESGIEDPNMKSLSYNSLNIHENVENMSNFYQYSKLQAMSRKVPIHKLQQSIQSEALEVKDLLLEGKKERRILCAKLRKSENDVSKTCEILMSKGFGHIEMFRKDMISLINKNRSESVEIKNEMDRIEVSINQLKKDVLVMNSLLKECEHELGVITYSKCVT